MRCSLLVCGIPGISWYQMQQVHLHYNNVMFYSSELRLLISYSAVVTSKVSIIYLFESRIKMYDSSWQKWNIRCIFLNWFCVATLSYVLIFLLVAQGLNAVFDALVINKLNVLEFIQKLIRKDKLLEVSPQRFCSFLTIRPSCTKIKIRQR